MFRTVSPSIIRSSRLYIQHQVNVIQVLWLLARGWASKQRSASNRNEYQEYFLGGKGGRCVGATTSPPSCADCLEIWEPHPPGTVRACPGL